MYRGRPWTMRQFAGFGTAEDTNPRFRYLLENGQTGLSTAFDMPTLMGYDSDHRRSSARSGRGRRGRSLDDMRRCSPDPARRGVDLDDDQLAGGDTARVLRLVGEEQGVSRDKLRGTMQNDILKEYIAQKTRISRPSRMRLIGDIFVCCAREMPLLNTISISGYHIREAGLDRGAGARVHARRRIRLRRGRVERGLDVDDFAPRLSYFFDVHNDCFEEIAKFRAARRIWARVLRERFGARNERSLLLRFHTQTAGVSLTAQQPEVNIVRTAIQALAAVLGGTQSLHTNSFDEALALPTEDAARLALRTQQVIAHESGVGRDRPARRRLLRRGADRTGSRRRRTSTSTRSTSRRRHPRDQGELLPARDRRGVVPLPGRGRVRASASSSASTVTPRGREPDPDPQDRPGAEQKQIDRLAAVRAHATRQPGGALAALGTPQRTTAST